MLEHEENVPQMLMWWSTYQVIRSPYQSDLGSVSLGLLCMSSPLFSPVSLPVFSSHHQNKAALPQKSLQLTKCCGLLYQFSLFHCSSDSGIVYGISFVSTKNKIKIKIKKQTNKKNPQKIRQVFKYVKHV